MEQQPQQQGQNQQQGTHGHRYDSFIDGDLAITHRDGRVLRKHKHARSNVRGPLKTRSYPIGSALAGSYYAKQRTCVVCGHTKHYTEFLNHAISPELRKFDGLNIRCRGCQQTKYLHGYKKDDGFIVDDSDEEESEESSSEVEEESSDEEESSEDEESEDSDDGFDKE
jgi:hypothetical protein